MFQSKGKWTSKELRLIGLIIAFVGLLFLSPIFAGEFAYLFATENMGVVAYIVLALLYGLGITLFAIGIRRLLSSMKS